VKIVKPFTLPTSEVTIFWESGPGKLKDLGEPDGRLVNEKGTLVEFYRRTDLKPGDTLAFQIVGFRVRRADSYTWAVLVAVFAGVVVVALSRSRPRPAESGQEHA
jgi:hypothetical protein